MQINMKKYYKKSCKFLTSEAEDRVSMSSLNLLIYRLLKYFFLNNQSARTLRNSPASSADLMQPKNLD